MVLDPKTGKPYHRITNHRITESQKQSHNHTITQSQNRRIVEVGRNPHLVQSPCSRKATQNQFPRTMSKWILNISKGEDSTTSLGNLLQCSITVTVKKCFLMFEGLLCFSLCPLPLCCYWAPLKRVCLCLLCTLPSGNYIHWRDSLETFSSLG